MIKNGFYKVIFICIILLMQCAGAIAQDIHFSQFYQTPMLINPALTGVFNGQIRAFINYKDQWRSIDNTYRTYMFSYDMGLLKKKWKNNYLGTGIFAYSDKAGEFSMTSTQVSFSVSDVLSINSKQKISVGLQGGFAQRSIDFSALKWGNQFNGVSYDPSVSSGEENSFNNSRILGDFSTGISWNYISEKSTMSSGDLMTFQAGVAMLHVNKPRMDYYDFNLEKLYSRIIVHGSGFIGLKNTNLGIAPSVVYFKQGTAQEINFGSLIRYSITQESKYTKYVKESAILLGGFYRLNDAFIPTLMFEKASLGVGISYDVNASGLRTATGGKGGIEISIRYINPNPFRYGKGSQSMF